MAMDDALPQSTGGAWGAWATQGLWGEGLAFPGYPYLAELSQRAEYRNGVDTIAEEITRKWIKFVSTGDEDKTDKIQKIEAAFKRFQIRDIFNHAAELDGFMGMGMIYIDTGATDDPEELRTELPMTKEKTGTGDLKGFVVIDPLWVSPVNYNATDPLKPDFLKPWTWYVMGKEVHSSRLMIVRSRELPDLLKAAYNFGGLSLSQIAKPYVDNWLRTRQSVSDLIHSFTVFVLKTVMGNITQATETFLARLQLFILGRDNQGLFVVDKEQEEFDNVSAPLGGIEELQAQAQEQMAAVWKLPLVKLLGITPAGLNNTTDGEIRVLYDHIHAVQEKDYRPHVKRCSEVIQLNEFGEIDPDIDFEFEPLWELDDAGKSAVQKTQADTDAVYVELGAISNEEVRTRLAGDLHSPYHGLKGDAPEYEDTMQGQAAENAKEDLTEKVDRGGAEGSEEGANSGV
jgi:phage-related protein (TIGR01555 family)